jgi:ABC-type nitrate/sulfonate/bicarbonate transport system substrate-binding protein
MNSFSRFRRKRKDGLLCRRLLLLTRLAPPILLILAVSSAAYGNPYLAKPGERPLTLRIATCAVSGGFVHLYTAIDNKLFSKYGLNFEHIYIQASAPSLAALAADEIQFLYCAADATLPTMASGIGGKIVASPLLKLPYVMVSRKEIKRPEDLRGKTIGIARAGNNLSERLSRAVVRRFNIPQDEVIIRPVGGSQSERFQAMRLNFVQAIVVTPPLDVRAKNEGFNVLYRLVELGIPFIYSSVHASGKMLRERPDIVQRVVAAFAETVYFVEKNPDKAKAAIAKAMRTQDQEALQASYDVYAREIVDRRMAVPERVVADTIEQARQSGINVRVKPEELYDNSFTAHLEKSGFLKELWGSELSMR